MTRFDSKHHAQLVTKELEEFLSIEKITPDKMEYENALLEITNYSANGINALLKFKKDYPAVTFSFEESFENESHRGKIDCIVRWQEGIGIWDFKRSKGGIPQKKEMKEFEKIQLWYYLYNLALSSPKELQEKLCFMGYLNLSEIEQSMVVINTDSFLKDIPTENLKKSFSSPPMFIDVSFKDCLLRFQTLLTDKIGEISRDHHFLPIPQKEEVCKYCWIDHVCIKEVLS